MTNADEAATATSAPLSVRGVLRIPDYRRLFAGQVVSDIGDGITMLLLLLVINDLSGGTAALPVALMAIAEAVPQFTVGLVAGVYVDRWNRRTVMLAADLVRAVLLVAIAISAAAGIVPLLYVLAFATSSASTFFRPARGALLPRIVPKEGLPAANSLAQGSQIIGSVVGAGIAGVVFGTFGSGAVGFLIDAGTYLVSFAFISGLASRLGRIATDPTNGHARVGSSLLEGLTIVRGSRALSGSLSAMRRRNSTARTLSPLSSASFARLSSDARYIDESRDLSTSCHRSNSTAPPRWNPSRKGPRCSCTAASF